MSRIFSLTAAIHLRRHSALPELMQVRDGSGQSPLIPGIRDSGPPLRKASGAQDGEPWCLPEELGCWREFHLTLASSPCLLRFCVDGWIFGLLIE